MSYLFTEFLRFARQQWEDGKNPLIYFNHGLSKTPSLALLFLVKVVGALPSTSYQEAMEEFSKQLQDYFPGAGICLYLRRNWGDVLIA